MSLINKIRNYFFIKKYPFMKWYGDPLYIGYPQYKKPSLTHTWYDEIPEGWRKAFGKQLLEELKNVIQASKDKSDFAWEQIKEKYGGLRLYANCTKAVQEVLGKYELMSEGYCIRCGKPARYKTRGWITYFCEDCHSGHLKSYEKYRDEPYTQEEIDKIKKDERLTIKDIPILTSYHKGIKGQIISRKVNIKRKYGIDFKELWGLKDE